MSPLPNLVFIMTDHQRADSIGMVQDGREVCPNLNRLAAEAAHFARTYNTCPLCVPARTALATSTYPTANGVVRNGSTGAGTEHLLTLQERLHQAGWAVAHSGVHHIRLQPDLPQRLPFALWSGREDYADYERERGLTQAPEDRERFRHTVVERQNEHEVEARYSSTFVETWPGDAEDFRDFYWARKAVDFIEAEHDRPFALFLHFWAPHPPLQAPEPYASMFDPAALELPRNVGRPAQGEPPGLRNGIAAQLADGIDMEQWRRVWAAHLGLVRLADDAVGRVLGALDRTSATENTLLAFMSDHGDHLGQHGMYQKMEMYEQAIRVPMMFAGPSCLARTVDLPVSHLDVLPTILDLLGLDAAEETDGLSLAPAVRGEARPPERLIFSQYSGNPAPGDLRRCVIDGAFKYIWSQPGGRELYDLGADPLEMDNLAARGEYAPMVERLHRECLRWAEEHQDHAFLNQTAR